ncbi:MAG: CDP-diacylglycerol--glycerol-3-phosphate 3-phosphatidyltransferase [Candidatus Omnitrophica bacterium CG11_big_fil_rev_8_21_14_0_20_42_13]|uniref:CDP-diacylglycerol--glycerol-3-phosphate 3-phosphatidyltransferase n=1 Tax=Candidatus Ghiorseimicrobium undicola TaxID=1974746 RepID=A0A2H0LZL0_9BACT|nr:MAG: CDP-diacylglycerol--glycerol-3-phosphate 3-phosphatidyltransferase [Candidatus Omnitrophica bacterium CG11_big_fil_rev_8_21_14_0_20_42_13]
MRLRVERKGWVNFANKVSIFRIISIPFFLSAVLYYSPQRDFLRFIALGIFLLAVVSDFIDGYIARVKKQKTKFGSIVDPLADKLLLISSFLCLYIKNDIYPGVFLPLGVVLVIISRDVIILLGAIIIYLMREDLNVKPSAFGKFTTFFQMLTIILFIMRFKFVNVVWVIAVFFTIVSGIDYLRKGVLILSAIDVKNNFKHNS